MNYFGNSGNVVDKWSLDTSQYSDAIKGLEGEFKKFQREARLTTQVENELIKSLAGSSRELNRGQKVVIAMAEAKRKAAKDSDRLKKAMIDLGMATKKESAVEGELTRKYKEQFSTLNKGQRAVIAMADAKRKARQELDRLKQSMIELGMVTEKQPDKFDNFNQKLDNLNKTGVRKIGRGLGIASIAVAGLGYAMDKAMARGFKYSNLQRNVKINIDAAQKATGGLVDKMSLLTAASRTAAFGLKITEKEFSSLSRAATIAAQRMGTDTNQAINDLIVGLGRMQPKILDNLGVIVKAEVAYAKFAHANNITGRQLTEVEKQAAFTKASIDALNKIAKEGTLDTESMGAAWARAKNKVKDASDQFLSTISSAHGLSSAIDTIANSLARVIINAGEAIEAIGKVRTGGRSATERQKQELHIQRLNLAAIKESLAAGEKLITIRKKMTLGDELTASAAHFFMPSLKKGAMSTKTITEKEAWEYIDKYRSSIEKATTSQKDLNDGTKKFNEILKRQEEIENKRKEAAGKAKAQALAALTNKKKKAAHGYRDEEQDIIGMDRKGVMTPYGYSSFDDGKSAAQTEDRRARLQALEDERTAKLAIKFTNELLGKSERQLAREQKRTYKQMMGLGINALTSLTNGLWQASLAAIQGKESFGEAMASILQSTLMSVSYSANALALQQLGYFWAGMGPQHLTSAGYFFAAGTAAGIAGLAVGAAIGPEGGSKSATNPPSSNSASRYDDMEKQDIKVIVQFDRSDPASRAMANKKISAQIQAAKA